MAFVSSRHPQLFQSDLCSCRFQPYVGCRSSAPSPFLFIFTNSFGCLKLGDNFPPLRPFQPDAPIILSALVEQHCIVIIVTAWCLLRQWLPVPASYHPSLRLYVQSDHPSQPAHPHHLEHPTYLLGERSLAMISASGTTAPTNLSSPHPPYPLPQFIVSPALVPTA